MAKNTLGKFLLTEIEKRGMSAREFAKLVGVSNGTISNLLSYESYEKSGYYPKLDVLVPLSRAIHVDIGLLVYMVVDGESDDLDARLLSRQIQNLPEQVRELIDSFIVGQAIKSRKDKT